MRLTADESNPQESNQVVVATSRVHLFVVTEERLAKMHKSGSLLFNELKQALPEHFERTCKRATAVREDSFTRPPSLKSARRGSTLNSSPLTRMLRGEVSFGTTASPNADIATLRMQTETKLDAILARFSRLDQMESAIEKLTSAVGPFTSGRDSPSAAERRLHGSSPKAYSRKASIRDIARAAGRQPSGKFRIGSALEESLDTVEIEPMAAARLKSEGAAAEEIRRLRNQRANA
mmetsp:Transcript_5262/g.12892  ORF Transcript_5262/g.12892 Transcript_5262/m.12892 type:complete len:235 (-) Transcript_5262:300-1004(-)